MSEQKISKELFQPAQMKASEHEKITRPSLTFMQDSWIRIRKNKAALVSIIVLGLIVIMAFIGPLISGYTFEEQNTPQASLPPKVQGFENMPFWNGKQNIGGEEVDVYKQKNVPEDTYYWFGSDTLGRDQFTRVWKGTQISLFIGLVAAFFDLIVGVTYGMISGFSGGRVDNVMQRILEVASAIPNLVVVILMLLVLDPGIMSIIIAIAMTSWITMARVVRGQVLKLKDQEFVLASKTLGGSTPSILFKHLLPNLSGVIIINVMFSIPSAIFFEAFLGFIGLGIPAPMASLGTLISEGYKTLQVLPYMVLYPTLVLCIIMIAFNLIADGLRDAFDPKMRD
ncbi:oligopeptide ABC transporter permease [Listeria booriae]|uniref:ABC transporter permease n=1 Tax=Listeria booriae TaxID=1552123 RepID=A0A099WLW4_9LIST|nr:oligopeptide ABC transporter permease [Listeria booriae]KGL45463.1 peptide ABC transporter permease [Listeria booriae]MBC1891801.1 ABC transporter permease [Listeria booriae]MBC1907610.1 ABC transporter permease [Listeria booriae]MBC1911626.1 ABC transporter permease [Listeria booriae]MBC1982492.1 ABC transporter permease [Listeria booriae]